MHIFCCLKRRTFISFVLVPFCLQACLTREALRYGGAKNGLYDTSG